LPAAAAPSPAVAAPAASLLSSPLATDRRLLVLGPAATSGTADQRVRDANASIVSRLHAIDDSIARHNRRWTVGDSTHRFGVASCGIYLSTICIPFGFSYLPVSSQQFNAVDRKRGDDGEVDAAIDRVRAMNSRPRDTLGSSPRP
jgi:hypothetical protein